MNDQEMDQLLDQSLGGASPNPVFRARVLLDSTAALRRARQSRARWRFAALSAAAVFIAAISFSLGRYCPPSHPSRPAHRIAKAGAGETVPVPGELVEWLHAARFFRQLGMEDRVALAYEQASKLAPYEASDASQAQNVAVAGMTRPHRPERGHSTPAVTRGAPSAECIKSIIAQSFGG